MRLRWLEWGMPFIGLLLRLFLEPVGLYLALRAYIEARQS
jgi:hypothetical protein